MWTEWFWESVTSTGLPARRADNSKVALKVWAGHRIDPKVMASSGALELGVDHIDAVLDGRVSFWGPVLVFDPRVLKHLAKDGVVGLPCGRTLPCLARSVADKDHWHRKPQVHALEPLDQF